MIVLLAVEFALSAVFLWCAVRRPKLIAGIIALMAIVAGYAYSLFTHSGSAVAGRSMMQAAIYAPASPSGYKLESVPIPSHTERTLLIKVEAAALNPSNYKMLPAQIPFLRHLRSWVIGYDVAGTVISKGSHSDCDVQVGDRVWGMAVSGSIAEYALMSCYESIGMARIPSRLSFEEAAGLPVAALTGLAAYERNLLQRGDQLLVIGASGGCGMFGVSMGVHAFGANVTGLCSTKNVALVESFGAHQVVDYREPVEMERLSAGGPQFDVIYDTVTSDAPEDPNYEPDMRPLLKPGGRYIAIGPSPDPLDKIRAVLDVPAQFFFGLRLQRPGYDWFLLQPTKDRVRKLSKYFDDGLLKSVLIDSTFSIDSEAAMVQAMDRMMSRRAVGKIIVKIKAASV